MRRRILHTCFCSACISLVWLAVLPWQSESLVERCAVPIWQYESGRPVPSEFVILYRPRSPKTTLIEDRYYLVTWDELQKEQVQSYERTHVVPLQLLTVVQTVSQLHSSHLANLIAAARRSGVHLMKVSMNATANGLDAQVHAIRLQVEWERTVNIYEYRVSPAGVVPMRYSCASIPKVLLTRALRTMAMSVAGVAVVAVWIRWSKAGGPA